MSFKSPKSTNDKSTKSTTVTTPLTLSKIKKILESPPHKANKNILLYKNFTTQAQNILNKLSVEERYNFLNNHLNEAKLNKWNDKKSKVMKISKCSFQHTPLSISWYNFTYAHTSIESFKIWYKFINLMISFPQGSAECDLKNCQQLDCKRHMTIIDQLYSFVNTSDESYYTISTQEFTIRNGFKLLLKIFNNAGINNPIPPLILCENEYKQHEFLSHFVQLDFHFLFAISPNEVRFSWVKKMLYNGHPIMSNKKYIKQLLLKFYPKIEKKNEHNELGEFELGEFDEKDEQNDENNVQQEVQKQYEISKTAQMSAVTMGELGVFSWLLATLPSLLNVRKSQKTLLKIEFDKYEDTAANATLIDTMLDYLYWEESYIYKQIHNIGNIIMDNKNELLLFRYITNEYSGNVAIAMFIRQFIDIHIDYNRDTFGILFNKDIYENNSFYFKLLKHIFSINSMVSKLDNYLPFLLSKIEWKDIDQLLFDNLLNSILSYIERYVSNKSMMMKIVNRQTCNSTNMKLVSKLVDVKREKTKQIVLKWIIKILQLLNCKEYTQQFIYHLSKLHFKSMYQNESVEEFTLILFKEFIKNEFDIDLINYFIDMNTHILKELVVYKSECVLWSLCRCCFDKAIQIFLFKQNKNKMKDLFQSKQMNLSLFQSKYNNVFLSLSQSIMPDSITNTKRIQDARVNIFKMLCEYGKMNDMSVEEIKKCLLQKDEVNGKNSLEYAKENNYQSLYNEIKQFMS
eukprot:65344_1